MNKIKVLYDVFKTLKGKEIFNGEVKVEAVKEDTKIISFANEFSRNNITGETKVKINSELDIDGNKAKCNSNAEFTMKECHKHGFHGMHHMGGHEGVKNKLNKITFMLSILNNLNAEEKDDKAILTIDLKDILKEIKTMKAEAHKDLSDEEFNEFHKKFHERKHDEHHKYHKFIKELLSSEYDSATLNIIANKNNEVERIEITANGETNVDASVSFVW